MENLPAGNWAPGFLGLGSWGGSISDGGGPFVETGSLGVAFVGEAMEVFLVDEGVDISPASQCDEIEASSVVWGLFGKAFRWTEASSYELISLSAFNRNLLTGTVEVFFSRFGRLREV